MIKSFILHETEDKQKVKLFSSLQEFRGSIQNMNPLSVAHATEAHHRIPFPWHSATIGFRKIFPLFQ